MTLAETATSWLLYTPVGVAKLLVLPSLPSGCHCLSCATVSASEPDFVFLCRVDYGHAEAAHKYGSDPRKFNVMSKKFVTDDKGHVRVSTPLLFAPYLMYFTLHQAALPRACV